MSTNRIVVDYKNQEVLILLGVVETSSAIEVPYDEFVTLEKYGFDVVKRYNAIRDYTIVRDIIDGYNKEGFVIRFKSGFRIKLKYKEYVRLHSLMTQFSNIDIWKSLKEGTPINLENIPDEFDEWIRKTTKDLNDKFNIKFNELNDEFWKTINRKEYYLKVKDHPNSVFLLKRLNSFSNTYREMIWDEVRPKHSKPFWIRNSDNI